MGIVLTTCAPLGGCGLIVGHVIRENSRATQQESQVLASLDRYRVLIVDVDAQRLADMFTSDGELSHNDGAPHVGPNQILTFMKAFAGYKVRAYSLQAVSTKAKDTTARQIGTYAQTVVAPDGDVIEEAGSFEADWSQQPDGRWLLTRMHTSDPGQRP